MPGKNWSCIELVFSLPGKARDENFSHCMQYLLVASVTLYDEHNSVIDVHFCARYVVFFFVFFRYSYFFFPDRNTN